MESCRCKSVAAVSSRGLVGLGSLPHAPYDGRVHLVLAFDDVPGIVFHAQDKGRQLTFFPEVLFRNRDWQDAIQLALTIGGFITMLPYVPSEDPCLIEVEGHAIFRFGQ